MCDGACHRPFVQPDFRPQAPPSMTLQLFNPWPRQKIGIWRATHLLGDMVRGMGRDTASVGISLQLLINFSDAIPITQLRPAESSPTQESQQG